MSTLTQPPPVHFDAVRRFTVEEYYRLVEAGILEEDARVELLDGQIIPMAPIGPEHHWILDELTETFVEQRGGRFKVGPGRSLPIRPHDVPEPDLVLYRPGIGRRRHLTAADVLLVIEIADSTLTHDLGYKADLYRRAKIPEYWVVDVRHRCLRVFTLAGERYETRTVREGKASPQALSGVEIDVTALLSSGA
ncbi:MAG: Uma2 family endonuclease [Verrucomicrobia bacterium]|nr:Uma2 family endonuclease [Verrucomicrobiota bacterium]